MVTFKQSVKDYFSNFAAIPRAFKAGMEEEKQNQLAERANNKKRQLSCPCCGSLHLSAGDQGFGLGKAAVGGLLVGPVGLLSGMIGHKKTIITCLNCGHKWKAGSR